MCVAYVIRSSGGGEDAVQAGGCLVDANCAGTLRCKCRSEVYERKASNECIEA